MAKPPVGTTDTHTLTENFEKLQGKGIGQHVDFTAQNATSSQLQNDHFDLQQQIQTTMQSDIMQPKQDAEGTLAISRQATAAATSVNKEVEERKEELDEIFIDVRGQLHHRTGDESQGTST